MRLIDVDALCTDLLDRWSVAETRKEELIKVVMADIVTPIIALQPTIQPELTDEQSIAHLQSSGWMQRHDKEMYESGLKEQLADDSDSYDSLLPTVQPEPKWIPCNERLPSKNGKYIVTEKRYAVDDKNHDGKYNIIVEEVYWYGKWDRAKFFEVTAWMSLPKPFIGSEEK